MLEMQTVEQTSERYVFLIEQLRKANELKASLLGEDKLDFQVSSNISAVLEAFKNALSAVAGNLPVLGQAILSLADVVQGTFEPYKLLVGILTDVMGASEAVRVMFENVLLALQPFIDAVGGVIAEALQPLLLAGVALLTALQPVIVAFVELLGAALQPITTALVTVFKPIIDALSPALTALFTALQPLVQIAGSLLSAFGTLLTAALQPVTWIIQNVLAPVLNGVAAVIRGVYNALATVINFAVAILTLGRVRNLVPLIGQDTVRGSPPSGLPDLREPLPTPPPTKGLPVTPQPPDDSLIGGPRPPGQPIAGPTQPTDPKQPTQPTPSQPTPTPRPPRIPKGGTGGGTSRPRTPTPAPTPPVDNRPTTQPDLGAVQFGNVSQGVQFAVMTPIVEASIRMLQAANLMTGALGGTPGTGQDNLAALPPFTASLERLTPVLDRLIREGVAISVNPFASTNRNGLRNLGSLRPL
jgi:hypothetical protein